MSLDPQKIGYGRFRSVPSAFLDISGDARRHDTFACNEGLGPPLGLMQFIRGDAHSRVNPKPNETPNSHVPTPRYPSAFRTKIQPRILNPKP